MIGHFQELKDAAPIPGMGRVQKDNYETIG